VGCCLIHDCEDLPERVGTVDEEYRGEWRGSMGGKRLTLLGFYEDLSRGPLNLQKNWHIWGKKVANLRKIWCFLRLVRLPRAKPLGVENHR
jgi:hypothetical protein